MNERNARFITVRNLPNTDQSAIPESSASIPPGDLRPDDNGRPNPAFSMTRSPCAHSMFHSAGSAEPLRPLSARLHSGWDSHAGNRLDERPQQKRSTSDETRSLTAGVQVVATVQQRTAGSFGKK